MPRAMLTRLRIPALALVAFVALALAATGFGHHLPKAQDLAREAYVLAGGSAADLCGTTSAVGRGDCPACQITGGTDLPPQALAPHPADLRLILALAAPRVSSAIIPAPGQGPGPRGPPSA